MYFGAARFSLENDEVVLLPYVVLHSAFFNITRKILKHRSLLQGTKRSYAKEIHLEETCMPTMSYIRAQVTV